MLPPVSLIRKAKGRHVLTAAGLELGHVAPRVGGWPEGMQLGMGRRPSDECQADCVCETPRSSHVVTGGLRMEV